MDDTADHVKEELLTEYDFDEFSLEYDGDESKNENPSKKAVMMVQSQRMNLSGIDAIQFI